ncbi:MAG: DUF4124 domain-containing protein [Bdellovibrionales bacterium]|nr:DUF4124 domain-containing protein [Massilia sp.]
MKMLTRMQLVAAGALMLMASMAQAQYVWVNEKGVKQFSDRAPPGSTPVKKILKSPSPIKDPVDAASTPAAAAASVASAASIAKDSPSLVDREADYRKRQAEKLKADAAATEAAGQLAQRRAACDNARAAQSSLATGRRLRLPDGSYMDGNVRAEQEARVNSALSQCN